jgi:glycerate 2-kinase
VGDGAETATGSGAETDVAERLILNIDELAARGSAELRRPALRVAAAGLAAAHPGHAVFERVSLDGDRLMVDGTAYPLAKESRIVVLGAGKASLAIAAALERILGKRLSGGAVAVLGPATNLEHVEALPADHPLPTERSVAAGNRLIELAGELGPDDIAICCFTGGSSALSAVPPPDVSLEEKRELHALLLASGMPITEVNAVRKHVSLSKGGRIAELAAPAPVINLTVSDVAGDPLDAITDPSVPDSTTPADAIEVLRDYGLWDRVAPSIRAHLDSPAARSPSLDGVHLQSLMLTDGTTVCDAMTLEATALGLRSVVVSTTLEGEARWIGSTLANLARESAERGSPFAPPCVLLGCGGEGTVELGPDGALGDGGPNQEAALAAALALEGVHAAALFLDTDGSDGGGPIAGALVDGTTAERARAVGGDLRGALLQHRATAVVEATGEAVRTGPTETNVNDLFVLNVGGESA